jgi:hypothetical protein
MTISNVVSKASRPNPRGTSGRRFAPDASMGDEIGLLAKITCRMVPRRIVKSALSATRSLGFIGYAEEHCSRCVNPSYIRHGQRGFASLRLH